MMKRFLQVAEQNGYIALAINRNLVELWCAKISYETESNHLHRISFIRGFAEYMIRLDYPAYVMPKKTSAYARNYQLYIFTNEELISIFQGTERLKSSK